jgi:flavin reductase (DIM6/NTAB) family NADH-FMN oxidoreductase RutF
MSAHANRDSSRDFRLALGCFATGVTVVTARAADGRLAGLTANSFASVSLDPPLVLWSVSRKAPSLPILLAASHFAIHVLAEEQHHVAVGFATPGADKYAGVESAEGLGGAPLLNGAAAVFECRRRDAHDGGDHVILLAEVERYTHTERAPLLFHRGRYATLQACQPF